MLLAPGGYVPTSAAVPATWMTTMAKLIPSVFGGRVDVRFPDNFSLELHDAQATIW